MAFSEVGKKKLAGHAVFLILDIICLGLAVKVNKFHDFFYYADIFPLGLSIVTLILISVMVILDVSLARSWTAFPPFEIIVFVLLSIFWLSFNAFSTSRWMHIPMACSSLPSEYRVWCRDTNALKAFVWLTFVVCLLITLLTFTYTLRQYTSGHKHVLTTPLSRYRPKLNPVSHHRSAYSVASGFSDFFPTAQRVGGADPFERAPTPVEVVSSHGHGHGHSPSGNHGHGHGHGYGHGYGGGQQMSEKQPPQAHEPYGRTFEKVQGW